jgi:hypothetical protein
MTFPQPKPVVLSQDDMKDLQISLNHINLQSGYGEITIVVSDGIVVEISTLIHKKKRKTNTHRT